MPAVPSELKTSVSVTLNLGNETHRVGTFRVNNADPVAVASIIAKAVREILKGELCRNPKA